MHQENEAVKSLPAMASPAVPYLAPFFVFMLLLMVEGFFPNQHFLFYPVKIALVTGVLAWYWHALPSFRPAAPIASAVVGVAGVVLWVGLDPWSQQFVRLVEITFNHAVSAIGLTTWQMPVEGVPIGRDPFHLYPEPAAWTLFALRVAGIALCVPVMEELFWRGFLMRWLIAEDFTRVPLGTYRPFSFWTTTACFALVHGAEWPLAVIVGVMYGFWFVRMKTLGDIMIAHGVTNFLLAFYCLFARDWHFLSVIAPVPK